MSGIYIHIPFCASRCIYCDFYSTTLRGKGQAYADALQQEMIERKDFLPALSAIRTLYLGGGTPSQLPPDSIHQIIQAAEKCFDLRQLEEVTMEANPEDFISGPWAKADATFGHINRISMGVQTMVDAELQLLHRRHSAQHVRDAVAFVRRRGIRNLSLDLMYGLPTQTLESWAYSIDQLLELHPEHISAYNLSIEPGTCLSTLVSKGELTPCDDDTCIAMASLLRKKLRAAGYEQYEISNYALPDYHSRHNSSYWNQTPYLGLGPGAHSYDGRTLRCSNLPRVMEYLRGHRIEENEYLTPTDLYNERIMLGLRTSRGVWINRAEYISAERIIARLNRRGLLYCYERLTPTCSTKFLGDYNLVLSEAGLALADEVIRDLMI